MSLVATSAYISKELHQLEVKEISRSLAVHWPRRVCAESWRLLHDQRLDEPIIVVRGMDGTVRALNAACRHRSMLVVRPRNAKRFTCPTMLGLMARMDA